MFNTPVPQEVNISIERDPLLWTGKLMLIYRLVRRTHKTYTASYFYGRIQTRSNQAGNRARSDNGRSRPEARHCYQIVTRLGAGSLSVCQLKASLGASKLTADQQRIRELERELATAKMERDILKKRRCSSRRSLS